MRDEMESFGRKVIRDSIPEQHRAFYAQLPFATVGHVDSAGRPWASLLVGRPGFLSTPDARSMHFAVCPVAGDPLATSLSPGLQLGFLGMDPATRRRNRLTGRVTSVDPDGFSLEVDQAFGNCPQYIQTRAIEFVREPNQQYDVPPVVTFTRFDQEARTMIESADTFFVASASSDEQRGSVGGADASHRGGLPGFVGVEDNGTLVIPDYSGNNHFNTLGNFIVNPKAGLLFVDFETGDLLMLSGTVEIVWEGPEVDSFRGAERLWKFRLTHGMRLRDRLPVRWSLEESSPHNTLTGTWAEARATREADAARKAWRPYRVMRVVDESDEIRSFYLVPDDGGALPTFRAGQHLPIRVTPVTGAAPVLRTYTLSSAPGDVFYRISIKREA
ncbi:MAG: pyridoxamine 5'-phosphate oxidase family protein, partial [Kofleriaceae bacterium]|nr:pyridoxamine 5'-phosphate oxidase family protein [Kofleriaceae bacterium]